MPVYYLSIIRSTISGNTATEAAAAAASSTKRRTCLLTDSTLTAIPVTYGGGLYIAGPANTGIHNDRP